MQLYHNSHELQFREPFGAAPTGSDVRLSLEVTSENAPDSVMLRLWHDEEENLIEMQLAEENGDARLYSASLRLPEEPCLVWYYFIAEADGGRAFYSNNNLKRGGEGVMTETATDISYQITVFDKSFTVPEWYRESIMYQIFPDRFCRSGKISEISGHKSEYTIHEDWYEPLTFAKHPFENGPACSDFYGGNLKGIISKLDYLKELGIGTLYLNPIFEAFSNHRYDTGDYSKIDSILGTEDDFRELCEKCRKAGIRIILDGVFSHTGSDSIYFNKYRTYGEDTGAYCNPSSPYRSWYQWEEGGNGYRSWWGCSNLPNINETEPTYLDYILRGDNAIIKKWLRLGASGWRLDVADELPDEFIKLLRTEAKSAKADAVVIGEVWEDASNKVSYGALREYLLGSELDSVMNYPFKDSVLGFLLGYADAEEFGSCMTVIMENYPKAALYGAMNIIGTHDTVRVKTVLGGQQCADSADNDRKMNFRLSSHAETTAIERVRLAAFFQMTFVGVPCIYYGDEIGMQGLADPFNRMPYTWRCIDPELLEYYKKLTSLRNSTPCLRGGDFRQLYACGSVYAYLREISDGHDVFGKSAECGTVLCAVNRGEADTELALDGKAFAGVRLRGYFSGCEVAVGEDGTLRLPLGARCAEAYVKI